MLLIMLAVLPVQGQTQMTRQEYIDKYKDAAIQAMKTHGIPASITLAQGCLESANGNSDLAVRANNHFGIKCHNDWKGPTYYKKGDDRGKSCYRKYRSASESFKDHSDFLRYGQRYSFLFDLEITGTSIREISQIPEENQDEENEQMCQEMRQLSVSVEETT